MLCTRTAIFLTIGILISLSSAHADKRVALVIGNATYRSMPTLANPRNDAEDVGRSLRDLGFETIVKTDLDRSGMNDALDQFSQLVDGADIALVYYAGHGMQFGGSNYLLPVEARLNNATEVNRFKLVPVDDVLETLKSARGARLLVLDACRNNPVEDDLKRRLASVAGANRDGLLTRGFTKISASGLLIAYATQANDVANDGTGRNSPFTSAFLRHVGTPDLDLRQMLFRVQDDVDRETGGKQRPELSISLVGEFKLRTAALPGPPIKPDTARGDFEAAERVDTVAAWDAFLAQHPNGFHAALARERRSKAASKVVTSPMPTSDTAVLAGTREKYRGWTITPQIGRGTTSVNAVAVTPDGARIVTGSRDTTVKIWDAANGPLLRTLQGHSNDVNAVAVTRDGSRIVTGSGDKTVKIWDAAKGALLRILQGHSNDVNAVAVTRDGGRIVSGSDDKTVKIWDAARGKLLHTLQGHSREVRAVAVTPDGARIVSGSDDKTVNIWDAASGSLLRTLRGHSSWVSAVAVTPDGARIVSGSGDHTVRIWDAASGRLLRTLQGHSHFVTAVAVTPDGARIVSGSRDTILKIWDLASGSLLHTLQGHSGAMDPVAVTPDGARIVFGSYDGIVKVRDADNGTLSLSLIAFEAPAFAAIRADGSFWANAEGLSRLTLVRGNDSMPIPDDYKAAFMRETPFEPLSAAQAR